MLAAGLVAPATWSQTRGTADTPASEPGESGRRPERHVVQDQVGARRYQACIKTARQTPEQGLALAETWDAEAGAPGGAPEHCAAIALVGLDDYAAAADQFDKVIAHVRADKGLLSRLEPGSLDLKLLLSGLMSQAGNARLAAGRSDPAREQFRQALDLLPQSERFVRLELHTDLARAEAAAGDYRAAVAALDRALALDKDRLDVRLYRATAYRHLGELDRAEDDVEAVLQGRPQWGQAWLEKGNIRARKGDYAGARSAWHSVLRHESDTAAAASARDNLNRLDPQIEERPRSGDTAGEGGLD